MVPPHAEVPLLSRGLSPLSFRGGRVTCSSVLLASYGCLPCKSHLCFFPIYTAVVVHRVVIPAATVLRLSLWCWAFTRELRSATLNAPGRMSTVTLCVSKTLAVLALQRASWHNVRLRHFQTAELGERLHPQYCRAPCYGYYEVRGRRVVLGGVLVMSAGVKLHDTLDTNVQGFQ